MFERSSRPTMSPVLLALAAGLVLGVAVGRLGPRAAPVRTFHFKSTSPATESGDRAKQPPPAPAPSPPSEPVPVPVVVAPAFNPGPLIDRVASRLEALDLLDERIAEEDREIKRATRVILEAQELPRQIENELAAFQDVILPQMRQAVESRVAKAIFDENLAKNNLGWSGLLRKQKLRSEAELKNAQASVERASAGVREARQALERTVNAEHPKQIAEIHDRLASAKARLETLRRELQVEAEWRETLVRLRAESAFNEEEKTALAALDEAIRLAEEPEPSQSPVSKLEEAERLWRGAEAKRDERTRQARRDRIARAVRDGQGSDGQAGSKKGNASESP